MTTAFVIAKERPGRPDPHIVWETRSLLEAEGWHVDSEVVSRKRELRHRTEQAVEAGIDVVVAVGGDGTVRRVAAAVAETTVSLGIIPTGTGNLLAGNLGIPRRPDRAAQVVLALHRRRIDLGRVKVDGDDHDFAVACGVGFDAEVMKATGNSEKERWGRLAYVISAIRRSSSVRNIGHEIELDGVRTTTEAAQVFIANFGRMGPAIEPRRRIHPDDGILDVIVVRASGPIPGLLAGWEALRQTDLGETAAGRVLRAQARDIRIETDPRRLVEADGSVIGKTPLHASIRPGALTVIVPR